MTVYVDDMRAKFGRMVMCHMLADTDDELHAMAARIGVQRRWWQSPEKTSGSHYDIALSKRALAVAAGAIEITWRQAGVMNMRRRITGQLGPAADVLDWLEQHKARRRATSEPLPTASQVAAMDSTMQSLDEGSNQIERE
jgi:hypothetical protein